jgi:histidine triad (HIT) family protein
MDDCIQEKSKISEYASETCIFCKIIKGEIPSSKVYEDEKVFAFLDIGPVNKGHTLVIPKEHHETIVDVPDDLLKDVIVVVKKLSKTVKNGVGADGFSVLTNNYEAAGQVVPHAHFHIIPRLNSDGLMHWPQNKYSEGEMDSVKEKIVSKIS